MTFFVSYGNFQKKINTFLSPHFHVRNIYPDNDEMRSKVLIKLELDNRVSQ